MYIYIKALSGYNSMKQHVSIETAVTYLYTVRLDEMGKNNIKMGWIPTMDMAFSSKGKAARFRIQSAVADPGEGLGGPAPPPPIFLDQLRPEGRKKFFLDPPPPPPSPHLKVWIRQWSVGKNVPGYPFLGRASIFNFHYSVKYNGCVTNCVVHKFPFGHSGSAMIIIWLRLKLLPTLLESKVFHKKGLKVISCNSFTISFNTVLYCRIIF